MRTVFATRRAKQMPVAHYRAHVSLFVIQYNFILMVDLPFGLGSREKYVTRAELVSLLRTAADIIERDL